MKRLFLWGLIVPALLRRMVPGWLLESPVLLAARHPWITAGVIGCGLAIGGLAVSASGIVSIKASAGHWRVTEWFLQFSKTRSIQTHALPIEAPALDDPALVLLGAGHYDLGCRPCHGIGADIPRIARAMLPPPPDLTSRAQTRQNEELFYVVKHGIKLTGMPAWPAQQRDDEVWAIVAFLRRLPHIDTIDYRRLTMGDEPQPFALVPTEGSPPDVIVGTCARCHGIAGQGRADVVPRLAGQRASFLENALRSYADGRRHSGIMEPIAAALTDEVRRQVVAYYSARPSTAMRATFDPELIARGERLATMGEPARMIPACRECHGTADATKNPAYPLLDGQNARYLRRQLALLQNRARGGSEYVHLMHSFVGRLTAEHIDAVSAYFASMP